MCRLSHLNIACRGLHRFLVPAFSWRAVASGNLQFRTSLSFETFGHYALNLYAFDLPPPPSFDNTYKNLVPSRQAERCFGVMIYSPCPHDCFIFVFQIPGIFHMIAHTIQILTHIGPSQRKTSRDADASKLSTSPFRSSASQSGAILGSRGCSHPRALG